MSSTALQIEPVPDDPKELTKMDLLIIKRGFLEYYMRAYPDKSLYYLQKLIQVEQTLREMPPHHLFAQPIWVSANM